MQTSPQRPSASLLETLRDTAGLRVFVETASADGETALLAGGIFDTVLTMEADPARYATTHERLTGRMGILPLSGDDRTLLAPLMPRLVQPAVFWLNAAATGTGSDNSLLVALRTIAAAPQGHVILLPDAARFGTAPAGQADTIPGIPDILAVLAGPVHRQALLVEGTLLAGPGDLDALWKGLFPNGRPDFLTPDGR